jgi:hypothetical protein
MTNHKPKLTVQVAFNLATRLFKASGERDLRLEGVIREDFFYSTYYDLFLGEGSKTPWKFIFQLTGNRDIASFTLSYIEAMLWSTNDESNEQGGDPLDDNYGPLDISVETMRAILRDCRKFYSDNHDDIMEFDGSRSGIEQAGHDFWLTREGHGTGFWDRDGWSEPGRSRLTKASEAFGEVWLYVGDDGRIYGH